jgi:hypothetical protein
MGCLANYPEPTAEADKTLEHVDGKAHAGMNTVVHVIAATVVYDVNVIRVTPTHWPGINEPEGVAAIREAPTIVVASVNVEAVLAAKPGSVVVVRNTAMVVTRSVSDPGP